LVTQPTIRRTTRGSYAGHVMSRSTIACVINQSINQSVNQVISYQSISIHFI